jgi:hypothetical protein
MAKTIAEEYNGQAIPTARYDAIKRQLTQPLLDLLNAEVTPADVLLGQLNETLRIDHRLMLDDCRGQGKTDTAVSRFRESLIIMGTDLAHICVQPRALVEHL